MKPTKFFLLLVSLSLMSAFGCSAVEKADRPNVLVILTDDQGYGDFACTGNPWLKTPNIDKLYGESTRLTDFHVSPCCAPTRASLLTGHYTNRTGCWHTVGGRSLLSTRETTMADVFQADGYATGMFGKWHLGDNYPFRPHDRGFDEAFWHKGGGVGQLPDAWNNDYFNDHYFRNNETEKVEGYCTDIWFDEAISFMKKQSGQSKPFFTLLSTNAPHGPYYVADKYAEPFKNVEGVVNPSYYGMVANLDENMGKLLTFLDEAGLRENTIVVFLTDNGGVNGASFVMEKGGSQYVARGYNAGMRGGKISEYEGGHHVPCFIRWPKGGIKAGFDLPDLTAHLDLFPTLLDLTGVSVPDSVAFDGQSLKNRLSGEEKEEIVRTLVVDNQRLELPVKYKNFAVMRQNWRLVNGKQLFDVAADPEQRTDVAAQYPELVQQLAQDYEAWWTDLEPAFAEFPAIEVATPNEPVTLLNAMDMHLDVDGTPIPWKQEHVREGLKNTGWFAIKVPEAGSYDVQFYRYPPESEQPLGAAAPAGEPEPGTNVKPYGKGEVLDIVKARFVADGNVYEMPLDPSMTHGKLVAELQSGFQRIRAEFVDSKGNAMAAYYFSISKN